MDVNPFVWNIFYFLYINSTHFRVQDDVIKSPLVAFVLACDLHANINASSKRLQTPRTANVISLERQCIVSTSYLLHHSRKEPRGIEEASEPK